MSNAEKRALEKYPLMSEDDKEGLEALKYIGMECECASVFNEVQEAKQAYFIEGYNQAEKDLELTWEDVQNIRNIISEMMIESYTGNSSWSTHKEFSEEVLKRFKKMKEEEV